MEHFIGLVGPPAYIGLLGLAPVAIGVKKGWALWEGANASKGGLESYEKPAARHGNVVGGAAVTIANGGANISIHTPLFAMRSGYDIALIGVVFAIMILIAKTNECLRKGCRSIIGRVASRMAGTRDTVRQKPIACKASRSATGSGACPCNGRPPGGR